MNTTEIDNWRYGIDGHIIQGAAHISRIVNHAYRRSIIDKACYDLRNLDIDYDAIACCGVSGFMVVPEIAEKLNKNIVVIRKQIDGYSNFLVEGATTNKYIIIDDLICSGDTIQYIINTIYEETPMSKCVGVYCYMPEECSSGADLHCEKHLGIMYFNSERR